MSVAIDIQDQSLWNKYKSYADSKGDEGAGDLDDLFDGEEDDNEEETDDDAAPSSPPEPDEEDEADDDAGPAPKAEADDEEDEPEPQPEPDAEGDEDDDLLPPKDEEDDSEPVDGDQDAGEPQDGSDEAGGTADIEVGPAMFDEELAQKISEDALAAGLDADYVIYSRDFDRIEPLVVDASPEAIKKKLWSHKWLSDLEDETRGMTGVMAKDIERMLAARSQVVRVPGFRSGRLHSAGLHRVIAGDDRVFRRKHEQTSKDVSVTLLCDNSGSMHGQKIKVAMTAAYALSSTLERVGIKHEVLGFTTFYSTEVYHEIEAEQAKTGAEIEYGRVMPIYMPVFKSFGDRLTPDIRRRFAAAPHMHYMNANVDGESVEYAATRLLKRSEKRKVLIVLSDGQPASDGPYAAQIAHLKRTIGACEKNGIETIGIGILSDAVRHFYPKHFILNRVEELPNLVMKELKRILTA